MAKPNISADLAKTLKASYAAAAKSGKATPKGSTGGTGARRFKVGAAVFAGMQDLAERQPDLFATVQPSQVQPLDATGKPLAKDAASRTVGSLFAHRTRILNAAGI